MKNNATDRVKAYNARPREFKTPDGKEIRTVEFTGHSTARMNYKGVRYYGIVVDDKFIPYAEEPMSNKAKLAAKFKKFLATQTV